jgi:hypothetical protein
MANVGGHGELHVLEPHRPPDCRPIAEPILWLVWRGHEHQMALRVHTRLEPGARLQGITELPGNGVLTPGAESDGVHQPGARRVVFHQVAPSCRWLRLRTGSQGRGGGRCRRPGITQEPLLQQG